MANSRRRPISRSLGKIGTPGGRSPPILGGPSEFANSTSCCRYPGLGRAVQSEFACPGMQPVVWWRATSAGWPAELLRQAAQFFIEGSTTMNRIPQDNEFRKSSFTQGPPDQCVSVAITEGGVYVRDTKDPGKTTLHFTKPEWEAFLKGVRNGEFEI